jgi:Ca-activated chloride channel family protein
MLLLSEKWLPVRRLLAVTVVAMVVACPSGAQRHPTPEAAVFRADSTLVLVPVTVVDRRGAIVNGLARNAFTLTEDGVPQEIRSFSEEDAPVSMGIVLDLSGSMKRVLGAAKESLRALLNDANPADEGFLNAVSTLPREYSGFTADFDKILSRVAFEEAGGDTALIDTIYKSLTELRSGVHTRKALLVISDGMDNHSRHSRDELLARALESDAQIYTIAVGAPASTSKPIERVEEMRGLIFLDELAAKTGGISFTVRDRNDIVKAAACIGQALRNQYTIGYVPRGNSRSGQWHRIKVKVASSEVRAYARTGYRLD